MNRDNVVRTAEGFLGTREGSQSHLAILKAYNEIRPRPRGYKMQTKDAWCAAFVSAVFHLCGLDSIFPSECGCGKMIAKAKDMGIWDERDDPNDIQIGDVLLYDWNDPANYIKTDNRGAADHVGIISRVTDTSIYIIEGNFSNMCKERRISRNGRYIRGFIRPKYPEGNEISHTDADIHEVALDVIRGKYGNGKARKAALKAAGYDPFEVQLIVNALLKN